MRRLRVALAFLVAGSLAAAGVAAATDRAQRPRTAVVSEVIAANPTGSEKRSGTAIVAVSRWPNIDVQIGSATKYVVMVLTTTLSPQPAPKRPGPRRYSFVSTIAITYPGIGRTSVQVVGSGSPVCRSTCSDSGDLHLKAGGGAAGTFQLAFDTTSAIFDLVLDNVTIPYP